MRKSRSGFKMIFRLRTTRNSLPQTSELAVVSENKAAFSRNFGNKYGAQHQVGAAAIHAADKSPQIDHTKNTASFPQKWQISVVGSSSTDARRRGRAR